MDRLDDASLDLIFREALTLIRRTDRAVADDAPRDHARMRPASVNGSPMHVILVTSEAAGSRLARRLSRGNVEQTMTAPPTAIPAHDLTFHEKLPRLFDAGLVAGGKPCSGVPVNPDRDMPDGPSGQPIMRVPAARSDSTG